MHAYALHVCMCVCALHVCVCVHYMYVCMYVHYMFSSSLGGQRALEEMQLELEL